MTPIPWKWNWRVDDEGHPDCGIFSEVRPGHAYSVARCPRYQTKEKWEADAAFISRAVNCHDDLVALLKIFLGEDNRFQVSVGGNPNAIDAMLAYARKTFAEAQS